MPVIDKDYKQEFEKEHGEHATPVKVVTEPYVKRANIDDVDEPGEEHPLPPTPEYVLTAQKLLAVLLGSDYVSVDLTEDNKKAIIKLDQDAVDFLFPKEVPTAKILHEVGTTNTVITVNADQFDTDHAYDIYLEIESTTVHYGVHFVVMPYNGVQCFVVFHLDVEGEIKECIASFNEDGELVIDLPIVMTPESQDTKISIKRAL